MSSSMIYLSQILYIYSLFFTFSCTSCISLISNKTSSFVVYSSLYILTWGKKKKKRGNKNFLFVYLRLFLHKLYFIKHTHCYPLITSIFSFFHLHHDTWVDASQNLFKISCFPFLHWTIVWILQLHLFSTNDTYF